MRFITSVFLFLASFTAIAAPRNFEEAKALMASQVYQGATQGTELYCGCDWRQVGRSGGRVDLNSCNYQVRKNQNRAERIEWEHVVPASTFGRQMQCWQNGGRENCNNTSVTFNQMEADMHNLAPSIGEVNGDRSNYNYGMVSGNNNMYGVCKTKVDFQNRTAEPRDEVKGMVARITFYMFDRYNLSMSNQQERILVAWDRQFPITNFERAREVRITRFMGTSNPYANGSKIWQLGDASKISQRSRNVNQNTQQNVKNEAPRQINHVNSNNQRTAPVVNNNFRIMGNKNSQIYHIEGVCPGYGTVGANNVVYFENEQQAISSGFRKAKNCR